MKCVIERPVDGRHVHRQWRQVGLRDQRVAKLNEWVATVNDGAEDENTAGVATGLTCMGKLSEGNLMQYRHSFCKRSSRKITIS